MNYAYIRYCSYKTLRCFCSKPTSNQDIKPFIYNRNPRNLERLRLARKPTGYVLDNIFVEYWHKMCMTKSTRSVTAELIHNNEFVVVSASTQEWAIRKFLYSPIDTQAYVILAKIFAQRCIESGLTSFTNDINQESSEKVNLFLKTLVDEGITLSEPSYYNIHKKWHVKREKKPWTVLE